MWHKLILAIQPGSPWPGKQTSEAEASPCLPCGRCEHPHKPSSGHRDHEAGCQGWGHPGKQPRAVQEDPPANHCGLWLWRSWRCQREHSRRNSSESMHSGTDIGAAPMKGWCQADLLISQGGWGDWKAERSQCFPKSQVRLRLAQSQHTPGPRAARREGLAAVWKQWQSLWVLPLRVLPLTYSLPFTNAAACPRTGCACSPTFWSSKTGWAIRPCLGGSGIELCLLLP